MGQGLGSRKKEVARSLRVMIAGGGTGGHVIPALAIGRELRDVHGAEVRFVGTARGLETRLVPEAGFPLDLVRSGQLKGVSLLTRAKTLLDLPVGVVRCMRLMRVFKVDVVVGVGGYASGPAMMAALLLHIPTLAFEPNAVPGLTNRIVGKWVSAAAVNFAETTKYFRRATVTGIPVRADFFTIAPKTVPRTEVVRESLSYIPLNKEIRPLHLLVFGGSQGARIFNVTMPKIARQLLDYIPDLHILHQSGAGADVKTREAYVESGADPARWQVEAYLDDMPRRFADADLILCRSGASTVAELAAAGRASVLVPFPGAADDHQMKNAEAFERVGAAELRVQNADEFMPSFLFSDLSALLSSYERRIAMGERARTLAHPDAVERIAGMVVGLAKV